MLWGRMWRCPLKRNAVHLLCRPLVRWDDGLYQVPDLSYCKGSSAQVHRNPGHPDQFPYSDQWLAPVKYPPASWLKVCASKDDPALVCKTSSSPTSCCLFCPLQGSRTLCCFPSLLPTTHIHLSYPQLPSLLQSHPPSPKLRSLCLMPSHPFHLCPLPLSEFFHFPF